MQQDQLNYQIDILIGISQTKFQKKKKGFSVRGFTFTFPDITNSMKNLLEPSVDLIN